MEADTPVTMASDLSRLPMTSEKVNKTFREWAVESALYFYPDLGTSTYRVPALYFNHQNLFKPEQAVRRRLLPPPPDSSPSSAPLSSASRVSSSSSSVSSSPFPSPSRSLIKPSEDAILHEDVSMESGDTVSKIIVESSTTQDITIKPPGETSASSLTDRQYSDSRQISSPLESSNVCGNSQLANADIVLSGEAMPLISRSSSFNVDPECNLDNAHTESNASQFVGKTDCTSILPHTDKHGAECVTDQADEETLANGCVDRLETKVPSPKRKGRRRRKKNAKHAKTTTTENSSDEKLKEKRTHQHEQQNPPRNVLKEFTNSESEDDDEEEEKAGPNEKKESSTEPSPPSNKEHSQKNESSAQSSHHPDLPVPSKKGNQKLKTRGSRGPKTTSPPVVQVMFPPQESMLRRDRAMGIVLDAFQAVGEALEERGEGGLFILHGINYDHYLCRLPGRLLQGGRRGGGGYLGESPTSRGILDILILHPHAGMVLVQVKSVGGNQGDYWEEREEDRVKTVKQVTDSVRARSSRLLEDMTRELLGTPDADAAGSDGGEGAQEPPPPPPLDTVNNVLHVLAIPFVPREVYEQTLQTDDQSTQSSTTTTKKRKNYSKNSSLPSSQMVVLCKEDFEVTPNTLTLSSRLKIAHSSFPSPGVRSRCPSVCALSPCGARGVLRWWRKTFHPPRPRLPLDKMKEIVGRLCGPFSTLAVQPDTKCRSEVRTFGHCISETAIRYSSPYVTLTQFDLLASSDPYVALCGPPGSGKSLLLTLKAVQWLEQGEDGHDHVIVASLGPKMTTPPRDHLLQSAICDRRSEGRKTGEVLQAVFSDKETASENVETEVGHVVESLMNRVLAGRSSCHDVDPADAEMKFSSSDKFYFVFNDVNPNENKTLLILHTLQRHPLVHSIWWSTSEPPMNPQEITSHFQEMTSHFRVEMFSHVTRRPVHVQRVMKAVEKRETWKAMYATDSVQFSLPTEGPPVIWVQHQLHRHHGCEDLQRLQTSFPNHYKVVQKSAEENPSSTVQGTHGEAENMSLKLTGQTFCSEFVKCQDLRCVQDQTSRSSPAELFHTNCQEKDYVPRVHHSLELSRHFTLKEDIHEHVDIPDKTVECCDVKASSSEPLQKNGTKCHDDCLHSPLECKTCAKEVADVISELMIDSINPDVSPFSVGSTKFLRDPSKKRFGEAIKPHEILILTDSMSQSSEVSKSVNKDKKKIENLVHSSLVSKIQEVIPLTVLTEESSIEIALPGNGAVLTDISCVQGLEKKVVIYVPGNMEISTWLGRSQNVINQYSGCDLEDMEPSAETHFLQSIHQTNKSEHKNELLTLDTTNLCINKNDAIYSWESNECLYIQNGESSGEYSSLSSVGSQSDSSCSVCERAERLAPPDQRFVCGAEDTNHNTLIPMANREESVPTSAFNGESHLPDDASHKSDSREALSIQTPDSQSYVRDVEEDGGTIEPHTTDDICRRTWTSTSTTETDFQQVSAGSESPSCTIEDLQLYVSAPHHNGQEINDNNNTDLINCAVPSFLASTSEEHGHPQPKPKCLIQSMLQDLGHDHLLQESECSDLSTSTGKAQLPSWMEHKHRLISQRCRRRQALQDVLSDLQCGDVHRASTSIDPEEGSEMMVEDHPEEGGRVRVGEESHPEEGGGVTVREDHTGGEGKLMKGNPCRSQDLDSLLAGLSEVTRQGIYAAAACCLSQLVIVLP